MVLGLLVIGAVAYCVYRYRVELGFGARTTSQESVNSQANLEQASSDLRPAHIAWQALDRSPEGFKVEMPTDTKEAQIPAYDEQGNVEQVDMIYAYPDAQTAYVVTWADNPPVERAGGGSAERTLDMARDGALARTQATLIGESSDTRDGYPARDFAGHNQRGGIFDARLILARRRLYMLIVACPAAGAKSDEDVNRFFNSFSLTSAARND